MVTNSQPVSINDNAELLDLIVFCVLALGLDLHPLADLGMPIGVMAAPNPIEPIPKRFKQRLQFGKTERATI